MVLINPKLKYGGLNMEFDILKIGAELSRECLITKEQSKQEVQYKMSQKMLKILLAKEIITELEYKEIDYLNVLTFSPNLAKVYV